MNRSKPLIVFFVCLGCAVLPGWGCQKRIVRSNGLLTGLPGAQGGIGANQQSTGPNMDELLARFPKSETDESGITWTPVDGQPLRMVEPDGRIRLVSRSASDVMYHLMQTLTNSEDDLLRDQVLSQRTKRAYRIRGRDENEAVEFLKRNQRDIAALIAAIPMGEQTPGVSVQDLGNNALRLRVPRAIASDVRFTIFDVVIEDGSYRLLMVR